MDPFIDKGFPEAGRFFSLHDYVPGQPIPALIYSKKLGKVIVNPLKKWVYPYTLVTDPASITLNPGDVSDPIPMVIDGKGHFEIFDAFYQSSQPQGFTVTLFDPNSFGENARPILMNREIHVSSIASGGGVVLPLSGAFGTSTSAGRPYRWSESYWMDVSHPKKGAMIVAVFHNLSSSQNTIRFALHGRRWFFAQGEYEVMQRMEEIFRGRPRTMPYFWTTDEPVSLTGRGSQNYQMRFGDESWTELHRMSAVSSGLFTTLLYETDSGQTFIGYQDGGNPNAIRSDLMYGSGEFPLVLAESTLLEPNMKLTLGLTDVSGSPNTIWTTFAGRKVFADPEETELIRPGSSPGRPY